MDKGQRAIVAILAVVAVLLAVNLSGSRAEAQYGVGPAEPTVVAGHVFNFGSTRPVYRFWSDGAVDRSYTISRGNCEIEYVCTVQGTTGSLPRIVARSDRRLRPCCMDRTIRTVVWRPARFYRRAGRIRRLAVEPPHFCRGPQPDSLAIAEDLDLDCEVGISDLLIVLAAWSACQ